ncbi:MAG: translation initiation factor IF-5A [Candidatus Marsarchaeota archaeon]|nr:translation initiation factor IF-5A [Candidatus Marsarchaeota archaeon]MCL5413254.1 translation initiation factor IF-5A [Candidatus Marsarchaeota archaeon]
MYASMKDIKPGRFILIDGVPCRVVELDVSSPGKHGAAKMRVTAVGIFDGQKRTLLKPSSADIEVPIINKKKAQVVSVTENLAQLMDLDTYETYDVSVPEEFRSLLRQGVEVEVMESMGKKAISRVMSGGS